MAELAALFAPVWERICGHQREFFRTDGGRWFTYRVEGAELRPSQTELRIPRSDFERAFALLPVPPAKLNRVVAGPAYVWAVLNDPRISGGEW